MCGIFGAAFNRRDEVVDVRAALRALDHRGPDSNGIYSDRGVVLGHTRLSILDLSPAGHQPMASEDGDLVLVFNGEIYNFVELREELIRRGATFRSRSDTEVILHGYRAFGERVVERLDGMFAFALWDRKNRKFLLARDRAGKKPLFYTGDGRGSFRFGSSAHALLASGHPREADMQALPSLFTFGAPRAPRSMYKGIGQLPPASLMVVEEGKPSVVRRYWTTPFALDPIPFEEEEAVDELRRLFTRAVRRRLQSDVPVGAFLSGGIDSSIVVAVMAQLSSRPVKTFTLGFSHDPNFDETRYARMVADRFHTDHTEFRLEPSSFEVVERLVWMHDGPFGDSSAIPTAFVSGLARKHAAVALGGDGGDELFAGYIRFLALEAAGQFPSWLLASGSHVANALGGSGRRKSVARMQNILRRSALPLAERALSFQSYFGDLTQVFREDVAHGLPMNEPVEESERVLAKFGGGTTLSKILLFNYETYLPDDLLLKADRASMMHSLEVRSPFLDTELVEFAARLPNKFKRRGLTTKWLLRRAYRDVLPAAIMDRRKMGFGIPLGAWFRTDLRGYIEDHFAPGSGIYDYVQKSYVDRLVSENFSGRADHGQQIWLLLTFAVWLRSLSQPIMAAEAA
ncbi:MAG: asparagine synthase (glutamine-hydrolyzing) [Polyangiaceae bacterium]|nr:asparagine synthase (glutamine-hydrolyzing) [Polyangiaceae bacterium]